MSPKNDALTGVCVVNPEQAQRAMKLCWTAEVLARKLGLDLNCPVILVGGTSVAKTATVKAFVKSLNNGEEQEKYKLWLEHVSYYADAGDIGGIPFPMDGKTRYAEEVRRMRTDFAKSFERLAGTAFGHIHSWDLFREWLSAALVTGGQMELAL